MSAEPAAESLPSALDALCPKPAVPVVKTDTLRAANRTIPAVRVSAGRRVVIRATRSQRPTDGVDATVSRLGQKTARPKIASRAGSSVRPATSIRAMPIASAGPRLW